VNDAGPINSNEVKELLRLSNDLHDLPAHSARRKYHLLMTLCPLLQARVGVAAVGTAPKDQEWRIHTLVEYGWDDPKDRNIFISDLHGDPMQGILRLPGQVVTRARQDLYKDDSWYAMPHVREIRRQANINHCMYSIYHLMHPGWFMLLAFFREWSDQRPFAPRHAGLLHLFHGQLGWMYKDDPYLPNQSLRHRPTLSARLRQTLKHLLAGDAEKEIASKMGLSRHTVHVYVKMLYKHYGVSTRAELLARCLVQEEVAEHGVSFPDAHPLM
jgi:DNA-binding CsgD family transcriptional regulator